MISGFMSGASITIALSQVGWRTCGSCAVLQPTPFLQKHLLCSPECHMATHAVINLFGHTSRLSVPPPDVLCVPPSVCRSNTSWA
jgi:hypothetical protein